MRATVGSWTPDRDVELSVAADYDRACKMPAAVLVTQTVIGKRGEHLRLTRRRVFSGFVTVTDQTIRQREIKPVGAVAIGVEGDAVWVPKITEIFSDFIELPLLRIKLVEDVDDAPPIVGEVEHVGDEDAIVRAAGHEAHAFETLHGNGDFKTFGNVQVKRFTVRECDVMRRQFRSSDRR